MPVHPSHRLAALVAQATRRHTRVSPAPRGMPFLGLEHPSGSALDLLADLAAHGIFRKYEVVLDLGARLGASSRWLAGRLGCTAVSTSLSAAEAAAAASLTRTAHLQDQVHHVPVDPGALPFRRAGFTHVWMVEALSALAEPSAALAEALRVLRPGGHLAVQELVAEGPLESAAVGRVSLRAGDAWKRSLEQTGFADVVLRDVTARAREAAALPATARASLARALDAAARSDAALAPIARERAGLSDLLASGNLRLVHLLARRP